MGALNCQSLSSRPVLYKVVEFVGDRWVGGFTILIENLPLDVAKPIYNSLATLVGKTINEHEVLVQS